MNCTHEFKPGIVLAPIMGSNSTMVVQRGDTIYPVGGKFMSCMKCKVCGHSFVNELETRTHHPNAFPRTSDMVVMSAEITGNWDDEP